MAIASRLAADDVRGWPGGRFGDAPRPVRLLTLRVPRPAVLAAAVIAVILATVDLPAARRSTMAAGVDRRTPYADRKQALETRSMAAVDAPN
jgi:hypothetical protein